MEGHVDERESIDGGGRRMNISKESRDFLDRLNIYLISSGKNENEVREITGELEDHLHEAENNGKSVQDITGLTPKAYMAQIAKEMPVDRKVIFKYGMLLIVGALSFYVMGDAINGTMTYSWIQFIGYPLMILLFGLLTAWAFKATAGRVMSKRKELLLFFSVGGIMTIGFGAVAFIHLWMGEAAVTFGVTGRVIGFILCALCLVGFSLWTKTIIMVLFPVFVYVPQWFIGRFSLSDETQLIVLGLLYPIGFMISLGISFLQIWRKERRQTA